MARQAGRYRTAFRAHRVVLCAPILLALVLSGWTAATAPNLYRSTATLWVDNPPPAPTSITETDTQARPPAAQQQQILNELQYTGAFLQDVGHNGPLATYLSTHVATGGGPVAMLSKLRRPRSIDERIVSALSPKNVTSAVLGPQVLAISVRGPTPAVAQGTLTALLAEFDRQEQAARMTQATAAKAYYQRLFDAALDAAKVAGANIDSYLAQHPVHVDSDPNLVTLIHASSAAQTRLSDADSKLAQASLELAQPSGWSLVRTLDPPNLPRNPVAGLKIVSGLLAGLFAGVVMSALGLVVLAGVGRRAVPNGAAPGPGYFDDLPAEGPSGWKVAFGVAAGALASGALAGQLVTAGRGGFVVGLALVFLPVAVWRRPQLGPVILLAAAVTIEQFPYRVGPRNGAPTDRIPLFAGIARSVHVNPADLLILGLLVIWLMKTAPHAPIRLPRTPLSKSIALLLGAVIIGVAVGIAHHGDLRTSFTEVRPYFYLGATYLLSSVLLTSRTAIRSMLWALVLGSGFKAGLGILLFVETRHIRPRPEAMLGHEEAFFFALFAFLTLGLWLFDIRGRLRATATVLLPLVLVADLVNGRREAWLNLGAGLLVLLIIGLFRLPERRRVLRRIMAVTAVIMAFYLPAYWNKSGSLAQPARAVKAAVAPDPRDSASNLYRVQENANLKLNIKQGKLIGKGFGVPIDYALPIVHINSIDPLIAYVPHDGVLYVIMRMGVLGGIAFWSMVAIGVMRGCRVARSADREIAFVGAFLVCALICYLLQGYNDQGFFFYRIAFTVGSLLGVSEVASRLTASRRTPPPPRPAAQEPPRLLLVAP